MPEEGDELAPLLGGKHGLTPEQVAYHQRERLMAAVADVVAKRGYVDATITDVVNAAKISRRTFYAHFKTKEECFLAAFDALIDYVRELVGAAIAEAGDWPSEVLAALRSLLGFLAAEPDLARVLIVEALAAGPSVAQRFQDAINEFVPGLRAGRKLRPRGAAAIPETLEESMIGAIASRLSREIATEGSAGLLDRLPELGEFLLRPYLGAEEARRLAAAAA